MYGLSYCSQSLTGINGVAAISHLYTISTAAEFVVQHTQEPCRIDVACRCDCGYFHRLSNLSGREYG